SFRGITYCLWGDIHFFSLHPHRQKEGHCVYSDFALQGTLSHPIRGVELPLQLREVWAYGYCVWTPIPNFDLIVDILEAIFKGFHLKLSFCSDGPIPLEGKIVGFHFNQPKAKLSNMLGLLRS
ncbi:hypothetical protein HAX54_027411, partial [Datura stramonium]|nr:hypothetical protein [Datura stramonium]